MVKVVDFVMEKEAKLKNKMYKLVLYSLKVIPMILSGIVLANTILFYFGIDVPLFSMITTSLFVTFIYITSYAFKFCKYHRMFIHYFTINLILNYIDYNFGLPLNDNHLFLMYMIITGICLFLILYFKICKT